MTADTVSSAEVIWTVVAFVGFLVDLAALLDARRDSQAVEEAEDDPVLSVLFDPIEAYIALARTHVRREALRCVIQASWVGCGVAALLLPPPIRHAMALLSLVIVPAVLVFSSIVTALNSVLDRWDRVALRRKLENARLWDGTERRQTMSDESGRAI